MSARVILIRREVADYCSYCNRHQEKTMPETVFLLNNGAIYNESHRENVKEVFSVVRYLFFTASCCHLTSNRC